MPIIEANATGRPVITSNIGSMQEVAGEAACMVDPFDVQSIRTGILRVIEDRNIVRGLFNEVLKCSTFQIQNDCRSIRSHIQGVMAE